MVYNRLPFDRAEPVSWEGCLTAVREFYNLHLIRIRDLTTALRYGIGDEC